MILSHVFSYIRFCGLNIVKIYDVFKNKRLYLYIFFYFCMYRTIVTDIMDQVILNKLEKEFPDSEDIIQVYNEWGDSEYLQELFTALDRYEPDWNKEKELGSWAAEFILDLLEEQEDELKEMTKEQRLERFDDLLDDRYEDFRSGHQFARINNINLYLQEDEDLDATLAEEDEKVTFPVIR